MTGRTDGAIEQGIRVAGGALIAALLLASLVVLARTVPGIGAPFAGFRYLLDGTVARGEVQAWTGPKAGIVPGDRILRYDGVPFTGVAALDAHVAARPPGTPVRYEVRRGADAGARELAIAVPTQALTTADWTLTTLNWWVVGSLSLLVAGLLLVARPTEPMALVHAGILGTFGANMALFNPAATIVHVLLTPTAYIAQLAVQGYFSTLGCIVFPRPPARFGRWALLLAGPWALLGAAVVATGARPDVEAVCFVATIAISTAYLGRLAWSTAAPGASPVERARARWISLGLFAVFVALAIPMIAESAGHPIPGGWSLTFAGAAYPIAVAIAVIRHGLVDVDRLFRPTVLHTLVIGMMALMYMGLASAFQVLLGPGPGELQAVLIAAAFALLIGPLRDRTRAALDATLFRPTYDAAALVTATLHAARRSLEAGPVRRAYLDAMEGALVPTGLALYGPDGALIEARGQVPPPAAWDALRPGEPAAAGEGLAFALVPEDRAVGGLALGPKRAGLPYTAEDRALVAALGQQLALWLDHLQRVERELAQRREIARLEDEERIHTEFLNLVSHELRTPASAVLQALELAETEADPERRRVYDARVRRNMDALTMLLDDLLQAGRLQLGGMAIAPCEVDPEPLVREVAEELGPLAARRQVTIDVAVGEVEPIWADRHRLAQVFRNLIHNAIKYGPAGGTVRVDLRHDGAWLRGTVEDDGPGIPAAERPTLFQRFRPGAEAATRGGLGLGLYICRALVEAHGGEIGLDAEAAGTRFWFRLPA